VILGLVITHTRGATATLESADAAWLEEGPVQRPPEHAALFALAEQFLETRPADDLQFVLDTWITGLRARVLDTHSGPAGT